jgi:hypothetical protein
MAKRAQPERDIQVKLVKELRKHCRVPWFAVPNGGKRHIAVATKLKAEGVNPGVPDLVFVIPPLGRFAGLELKSENGVLSAHQDEWRQKLQAVCAWWGVAHSLDEAWGILAAWGCLPSASIATSSGRKSKATLISAG